MRILLSLFLILLLTNTTLAEDRIPVELGLITPLTSSQADNGQTIKGTAELITELILNKSKKYKYSLKIEDGRCGDGNAAATAAQKFINVDGIKFIISSCSGSTIQAAPIAEKHKALVIAVLSSHKDIKHLGDYIFRTYLDVEQASRKIAGVIRNDGNKRVAVLTEDNAFTIGISEIIEEEVKDLVVLSDNFAYDSTDFRSILTRARALKADALFLSMASAVSAGNMMNQIHQLKMNSKTYMFHMPDMDEFLPITKTNADGLKYLGSPKLSAGTAEYQFIHKEYLKRFKREPSIDLAMRSTFDAMMAVFNGIEKVGPDAEKVKDFLYSYQTKGALGNVEFDSNGDIKNVDYALKAINGKERVYLE